LGLQFLPTTPPSPDGPAGRGAVLVDAGADSVVAGRELYAGAELELALKPALPCEELLAARPALLLTVRCRLRAPPERRVL
jgi:hypothetical protein